MALPWFVWLLISVALQVIAYLIMPRPKRDKPPAVEDLPDPTADAERPIPVVFGSLTVTGPNVLAFADKRKEEDSVEA